MTRRFFSGNTLEQAVMAAARHYDVEPAQLAYRQIEKRHGFLRTRKAVVISVDPELPTRGPEVDAAAGEPEPAASEAPLVPEPVAPPAPLGAQPEALAEPVASLPEPPSQPEPRAEPRDAPPPPDDGAEEPAEDVASEPTEPTEPTRAEPTEQAEPTQPAEPTEPADQEMLQAAERLTHRLLSFAGIDAEARAGSGNERIEIQIEGPDDAVLVVESGKGLLAIQHLMPRLLRGSLGRSSYVRVDSRDFHRKRKERLEALATKEAEAASHSGSARTLPPMAPDERRLVHLALKDTPAVVTESRGTGLHKRVVIRPVVELDEHKDIEARHGF